MKKILSVLLALLILASTLSVAFAAPEGFPNTYVIRFAISDSYDGTGAIISYVEVAVTEGMPIEQIAVVNEYGSFVKDVEKDGETKQVKYYFSGWLDPDTGIIRTSKRLPKVTCDKTYVAVFEPDEEVEGGLTLMKFIAQIFERFNRILEYFYRIFFPDAEDLA